MNKKYQLTDKHQLTDKQRYYLTEMNRTATRRMRWFLSNEEEVVKSVLEKGWYCEKQKKQLNNIIDFYMTCFKTQKHYSYDDCDFFVSYKEYIKTQIT